MQSEQKQPVFVIGIDPQLNVLAFKTVHMKEDDISASPIVCWFQQQMKRKDTFEKAEHWESYMIESCHHCIMQIIRNIFQYSLHNNLDTQHRRISLWVEQQRGRCKTIPETALAAIAFENGIDFHIPHPKTWKKGIGFNVGKDGNGVKKTGNKANKDASEERYAKKLEAYYTEQRALAENRSELWKVPNPKHHLCDAACMCEYGCLQISQQQQ
jgi:hypothetical protein